LDAHRNATIQQYAHIADEAAKGAYYITHLSSAAQAKLCDQRDAVGAHTLTMEQRAVILQLMIQNFAKVNLSSAQSLANVTSSTALFFGKNEIAPLLANLSTAEMTALTTALATRCLNNGIFGCDQDQNLALDALRQAIKANGHEAAANLLSTVTLFEQRYQGHPDNNDLLDRIQCYAQARSQQRSLKDIAQVDAKFALEMNALLPRDGYAVNPDVDALLDHLENQRGAAPERNTPHMLKLIGDIRNLRRPAQHANDHDFDSPSDNEFEMDDMGLPGLIPVNH